MLQADQLELNNFSATGNLTLNGGNVIQQGALQVGGTTTLGASNVTLQDEANNFVGNVVLNSAGSVNLRDQQVIALQGSAGSLNVQAGTAINQSGALNVNGNSNLAAPTINLTNTANSFGGGVTVNATQQATVNASGDLSVGGNAEADLIAVRARGLATLGSDAVIRARMPYNDLALGTARSYAGLTLSIPLGGVNGQPGGLATFGESSGSGQSAGAGAIRVEVGDINRPGLGGFLTVLPFEGSNLLPGQVVYLAGPERKGTQAFFYDGARSLDRIPVVYNGSLLLSPQEAAALTTAQGAVVLARQEQTRSVVRTENVAGKIINGVVAEVGPGRPATEGEGGATKPGTCDAEDSGLSCAP